MHKFRFVEQDPVMYPALAEESTTRDIADMIESGGEQYVSDVLDVLAGYVTVEEL